MPNNEFDSTFGLLCFLCPPLLMYYGLAKAIDYTRPVASPPWFRQTVGNPAPPVLPPPPVRPRVVPADPIQPPCTWVEYLSSTRVSTEFREHKVCREGRKGNLLSEIIKGIRIGWNVRNTTNTRK